MPLLPCSTEMSPMMKLRRRDNPTTSGTFGTFVISSTPCFPVSAASVPLCLCFPSRSNCSSTFAQYCLFCAVDLCETSRPFGPECSFLPSRNRWWIDNCCCLCQLIEPLDTSSTNHLATLWLDSVVYHSFVHYIIEGLRFRQLQECWISSLSLHLNNSMQLLVMPSSWYFFICSH
ncbi:uncharacterized protein LOC131317059 [Rhododendron vialii]|uniref:uncharacterized protein LOC131317059 n=1 Tax=Rhododendron vialii TaxID=182163 RepID=UPI00265E99C1|nr:uncharacterized protein LOC131317059 [Rhododendron vialii]